jgi:hypothetical protein
MKPQQNQLNVMDIAWKIFKSSKTKIMFSFALKYAWKIVRGYKLLLESATKIAVKGKQLKKLILPTASIQNNTLYIEDDYSFNLFVQQARTF